MTEGVHRRSAYDTAEGTFRTAEAHLPRLQGPGVDILWLMPVNPIGDRNRKGVLGSPYAVRDSRSTPSGTPATGRATPAYAPSPASGSTCAGH